MLNILNLYCAVCQLYLTESKKKVYNYKIIKYPPPPHTHTSERKRHTKTADTGIITHKILEMFNMFNKMKEAIKNMPKEQDHKILSGRFE